jgi:hypothetical protein
MGGGKRQWRAPALRPFALVPKQRPDSPWSRGAERELEMTQWALEHRLDVVEFVRWAVQQPIMALADASLRLDTMFREQQEVTDLVRSSDATRAVARELEGLIMAEFREAGGAPENDVVAAAAIIPVAQALLVRSAMEGEPEGSTRRHAFDRMTGLFPDRPR